MLKKINLIVDEDGRFIAVYESEHIAKALLNAISEKLGKEVSIKKVPLNPDIKVVGSDYSLGGNNE